MEGLASLLPLLLLIVLLYFLLIRPQQKQKRQLAELQSQLHRGQRVMTNSMLYANVTAVDEDQVVLEIAPNVECRFSKAAIVRVIGPSASDETLGTEDAPPA